MRLLFAGTPDFAVPSLRALHRAGHDVALVVTRPDRPRGRGQKLTPPPVKKAALDAGLPVAQPRRCSDPEFVERLRRLRPRVGVVVAYGEMLDSAVLEIPPHGFVNLHASLLPAYRGAAPLNWAIIRGESETGVSVVRMVEEMDAGPILAQKKVAIGEDETAGELHDRLAREGAVLLADVVARLDRGETVPERPQDESRASCAPRLSKEDGRIDWAMPAEDIRNRVRGLTPWPGAFCRFVGDERRERVTLLDVAAGEAPGKNAHAEPGTVVGLADDEQIVVAAGRGTVRIRRLKPASARAMDAADFVHGRGVQPGDRFE